jgi:hypothetical protein
VRSEPERGAASTTTVPLRHPGNDAVARGKVPGQRFDTGGMFGQEQAFAGDALLQFLVFRRETYVQAAGDDRHRSTGQCADMCSGIDAARQTRDHNPAPRANFLRQCPGEAACRRRGVARADKGDAWPVIGSESAARHQHRRRGFGLRQQCRIIGIIQEKIAPAEPLDRRHLRHHAAFVGEADSARAAPRCKVGNGV